MKTIHLFYNGREAIFPTGNDWEKFTGQDSVRLFLTCAESWKRNGWQVKRLSTAGMVVADGITGCDYDPMVFTGRIAKEGYWYPADNWQLVAKAATLEPDDDGEIWIGSFDVFNYGFSYGGARSEPPFRFGADLNEVGCLSLQKEHFSMALFVCRKEWLVTARNVLLAYDREQIPRIPGKYTSDETILRQYATHRTLPLQCFSGDPDERLYPLVHMPRSVLQRVYDGIPSI